MGQKGQKNLDRLARAVAHGAQPLSALERAIFWTKVLQLEAPDRLVTAMMSSRHAKDVELCRRYRDRGLQQARLAATVDVFIESERTPNPARATNGIAAELFAWHDWASFEIERADWLRGLPRDQLLDELRGRAQGEDRALIARLLRELDSCVAE